MDDRTAEMEDALAGLASVLEQVERPAKMRFSLFKGEGWVTSSSKPAIHALCLIWNSRKEVATLLREALTARAERRRP